MERRTKGTARSAAKVLLAALLAIPLLMGACSKDDGDAPPTKDDMLVGKWLEESVRYINPEGKENIVRAHPDRPEHITFRADGRYEVSAWFGIGPDIWDKETWGGTYTVSADGKTIVLKDIDEDDGEEYEEVLEVKELTDSKLITDHTTDRREYGISHEETTYRKL